MLEGAYSIESQIPTCSPTNNTEYGPHFTNKPQKTTTGGLRTESPMGDWGTSSPYLLHVLLYTHSWCQLSWDRDGASKGDPTATRRSPGCKLTYPRVVAVQNEENGPNLFWKPPLQKMKTRLKVVALCKQTSDLKWWLLTYFDYWPTFFFEVQEVICV